MYATRPHHGVSRRQQQTLPGRPVANAAAGLGYWLPSAATKEKMFLT